MLIKPDGTYELYDWNAAKQYTWTECETEKEATQNRSKELFWRKFRPTTGSVRSLERLEQFLNKDYVLIRSPTNMIDFCSQPLLAMGLDCTAPGPVLTNLVIADIHASAPDDACKRYVNGFPNIVGLPRDHTT